MALEPCTCVSIITVTIQTKMQRVGNALKSWKVMVWSLVELLLQPGLSWTIKKKLISYSDFIFISMIDGLPRSTQSLLALVSLRSDRLVHLLRTQQQYAVTLSRFWQPRCRLMHLSWACQSWTCYWRAGCLCYSLRSKPPCVAFARSSCRSSQAFLWPQTAD